MTNHPLLQEQIKTQSLQHLGLIAAVIDKTNLINKIDDRLPLSTKNGAKVSMGQRVAAMIFNGLGFVDDRLYMFPKFLEDTPVNRLFGQNLEAKHFNDDAIGRCLDAIHEYGETKLFSQLAFEIGTQQNILGKTARFDTTSLSVYGDYQQKGHTNKDSKNKVNKGAAQTNANKEEFHITYGYSKGGRPNLKQMILNLATTGKANLPIWMEAHSGNASDKVILERAATRMKKFAQALKEAPEFLFVGDSAMYDACVDKAGDMLWLSRVPNTNKASKEVLSLKETDLKWQECDKGYRISAMQRNHKGVAQRWLLVYSKQKYDSELITLNKRIKEEEASMNKKRYHFGRKVFSCPQDAQKAFNQLAKELKYHQLSSCVEPIHQHSTKGRPKKESVADIVGYKVKTLLSIDEAQVSRYHLKLGRFILATNQLDKDQLSDADMLYEYKSQMHTESGFRFIKGNTFEVANVFLKKPSRVSALMMVMTLCLLVYNVGEYMLRKSLKDANASIPNQLDKPTQKPSMSWVCRLFRPVHVVFIKYEGYYRELISNVQGVVVQIIRYYGPMAERIYGIGS